MVSRLARGEYLRSLGIPHYQKSNNVIIAGSLKANIKLIVVVDKYIEDIESDKVLHGMLKVLQLSDNELVVLRCNTNDPNEFSKELNRYLAICRPKQALHFNLSSKFSFDLPVTTIEHPSLMLEDVSKKKVAYKQLLSLSRELHYD